MHPRPDRDPVIAPVVPEQRPQHLIEVVVGAPHRSAEHAFLRRLVGLGYIALVRPGRLAQQTRYLITDQRVLIQRGHDELCLDRTNIVDVIDSPGQSGLHDIFLVLDGPRARAVAASGAFGERDIEDGLVPVFHAVVDADEVSQILRVVPGGPSPLHDAA